MWSVIDAARQQDSNDLEDQLTRIEETLLALEPGQIAEFQDQLDATLQHANTWDLWAAAHIINGGASDDGFLYFRGWLLMQGRHTFEAALADAESLAGNPEIEPDNCECQDILYLAYRTYETKTGNEMPLVIRNEQTEGLPWEEDELEQRFPRLWAAFGEA